MDKQVDALMWELVYTFITKHPKEAAETIANYVRKPEYLYLIEHEKDVKKAKKRLRSILNYLVMGWVQLAMVKK